MDDAKKRRQIPCWHRKKNVGRRAIIDAHIMEHGAYALLKKYFLNHHSYISNQNILQGMMHTIYIGQCLDLCLGHAGTGKPNLDLFTWDSYQLLAKYKSSDYTAYYPMSMGMHLANCYDKNLHRQIQELFRDMNLFFIVEVCKLIGHK